MTKKKEAPADVILDASHRWLELVDEIYPVAVLATAVANWMRGQPVWLLVVAPPSSGKSLFIQAYSRMKSVYPLSSLTARTFASGLKNDQEPGGNSLLHWLTKERRYLLTLKDFGTVLSLAPNDRNSILAQLREIYDGEYSAAFGTGERFHWTGKLGLIAGATPKVDDLYRWSAELGERFVQIRPIGPDEEAVAARAASNKGHEERMQRDLAHAHSRAFYLAREAWKSGVKVPAEAASVVITLARLVARARTPVTRDRYTGGYQVAEPEGPARLAGVFEQLLRAAYVCYGEDLDAALTLVRRVAVDSIAPRRRHLVLAEISRNRWGIPLDGLDDLLRCDPGTARRCVEDLEAIGLITSAVPVKKAVYTPSDTLKDLVAGCFLEDLSPDDAFEKLFDLCNNMTYGEGGEEEVETLVSASPPKSLQR